MTICFDILKILKKIIASFVVAKSPKILQLKCTLSSFWLLQDEIKKIWNSRFVEKITALCGCKYEVETVLHDTLAQILKIFIG